MRYVFWSIVFFWWVMDFYVLVLKRNSYSKILDKQSKYVLTAFILTGVLLAILPEDFRAVWRVREFGPLQCAGTMVLAMGITIRLTAILTLGDCFAPDIVVSSDKRLVQKGLYKRIRHPSYTGEIVAFIGLGIVFQHIPSSIFVSLLPTLGFVYRAIMEERKLAEEFGEQFLGYKKRTRMFI
jgi:protein-S-isoprenylcysteine O-methyltransferase Ste14